MSQSGFEARHVGEIGLVHAVDAEIFDHAAANGDVLITADADFTMLVATRRTKTPSVILLRHVNELRPDDQAALLIANLPAVLEELARGAIVSLSPTRLAVRTLPIV